MAYRTSSLFHYTRDINVLKSILENGIFPNYCKEIFPSQNQCMTIGIPMVSFCDIPIKETSLFRERYGDYAIGLDKEWGIKNGINPILYVSNENIFNSAALVETYKRILQDENTKNGGDSHAITFSLRPGSLDEVTIFLRMQQMKYASLYILGFLKPYYIERNGKLQCNYEENEWRYIVPENDKIPWWWNEQDYSKWRGTGDKPYPTEEMKITGLRFEPKDIKWILTPDDESAHKMIEHIMINPTVCGCELNDMDKCLICGKIKSFASIEQDI